MLHFVSPNRGRCFLFDECQCKKPVIVRFQAELFEDWIALFRFRESKAPCENRVHFIIGNSDNNIQDSVIFTLDELTGQDVLLFDENHQKVIDCHFMCYAAEDCEVMKNFVFFRPKDGAYKGRLFRFSVAQALELGSKNHIQPVLLNFIRLLLAGTCDFTEITYYAMEGYRPGAVLPMSFPQLPLNELLSRANSHEFIDLEFDQRSCKAISDSVSTVESFSFTNCKFHDGGKALGQVIRTSKHLKNLELEACPISKGALGNTETACLKSLTLGIHYLLPDGALQKSQMSAPAHQYSNATDVPQLCDLFGLSYLRIVGREKYFGFSPVTRKIKDTWEFFLESRIKDHPSLSTLVYAGYDAFYEDTPWLMKSPFMLFAPTLAMVRKSPNSALEEVRFEGQFEMWRDGKFSWGKFESEKEKEGAKWVKDIIESLDDKQKRKSLRKSPYCRSLLSNAIHASMGTAFVYEFVFALLTENADCL